MKRKTGVNPVQGRCCVGVAAVYISLGCVLRRETAVFEAISPLREIEEEWEGGNAAKKKK